MQPCNHQAAQWEYSFQLAYRQRVAFLLSAVTLFFSGSALRAQSTIERTHHGVTYTLQEHGLPFHPIDNFVALTPWSDSLVTIIQIGFHNPPGNQQVYAPTINFIGAESNHPNFKFVSKVFGMNAVTENDIQPPPPWNVNQVISLGNWERIDDGGASFTRWQSNDMYSYIYDHQWNLSSSYYPILGDGGYYYHVMGLYATDAQRYIVTDKN